MLSVTVGLFNVTETLSMNETAFSSVTFMHALRDNFTTDIKRQTVQTPITSPYADNAPSHYNKSKCTAHSNTHHTLATALMHTNFKKL